MGVDHALTGQDAKNYFELFGPLLALSNVVDRIAYKELLIQGRFSNARSVLDIGAGNGHLADMLLKNFLPRFANLTLIEVAESLNKRLKLRFASYADRVSVQLVEACVPYPLPNHSFDRVVSSYVFDMMNKRELGLMINEAHRLLKYDGLLCLLLTGPGFNLFSSTLTFVTSLLYQLDPRLVGISRPVDILSLCHPEQWSLLSFDRVTSFGFPSEIVILSKIGVNADENTHCG